MKDPVKTCPMCRMEISEKARKCPHCHQYQGWARIAMLHPLIPVLVVAAFIGLLTFATIDLRRDFSTDDTKFEDYPDAIRVTESTMSFGESVEGQPTVVVVGTLQNDSEQHWKDVYIEVEYRGPDGRLLDVGRSRDRGLIIRAGDSSLFKVSSPREFNEAEYASHVARVKWAREVSTVP